MSGQLDSSRAYVTARRYVLWAPCCASAIVLQRETTDLQLTHHVTCERCNRAWKVSFLPDRRKGVQVCWKRVLVADQP
jgi:hypothetical protein